MSQEQGQENKRAHKDTEEHTAPEKTNTHLLDGVRVNGVDQVQDIVALALDLLHEGRAGHLLLGLARDEEDGLLLGGHARHVVLEGRLWEWIEERERAVG